ncbi:MAG: glycosyltransferase family 4 protein [Chromatiaceae bacterium]|nr:glycosyltransferase family 4 protein [Chromatiaceae bacterium]
MALENVNPTGIIVLDFSADRVEEDNNAVRYIADNILKIQLDADNYIEPLLIILRQTYQVFSSVCFVSSDVEMQRKLSRYFPELFKAFVTISSVDSADVASLEKFIARAKARPHFDLDVSEQLISDELKQLIAYFQLDERLTDIAEDNIITQMAQAFIDRVSSQQCAFSAFIQIRLLSFYANRLNKYGEVYFKTLSLHCGDSSVTTEALWPLVSDLRFSVFERFYMYNQILSMEFGSALKKNSDFNLRFNAYKSVVDSFAELLDEQLDDKPSVIPSPERNIDIVFVFVAQFISPRHAPSKIALDIIKGLCLSANKQVLMIDTGELLPRRGALPWYDAALGNRRYYETEGLTYEGANFRYLQLSAGMPNLDEIPQVIRLIKNYKPYFCITVGESMTADLCSQFVPNIVVPTTARLPHTLGQFRLADSSILPDNCAVQSERFYSGIVDFRIVPEIAASSHQRDDVRQGPLQIAIVGNRLDAELESSFFAFLQELTVLPVHFVFVGEFEKQDYWYQCFPELVEKVSALGFQYDFVSALDQCDVFLNYPRAGGGNSALYAMRSGLPVLTLRQGDVFAVAGEDFGFNSYADIKQEIATLIADAEYLRSRSQLALQKAANIIDKRSDINTLIRTLVANPLFETAGFVREKLHAGESNSE